MVPSFQGVLIRRCTVCVTHRTSDDVREEGSDVILFSSSDMMTEERTAAMTELGRTEERLRSLQQEMRE